MELQIISVVIAGYGSDNGRKYYRFYDPGTAHGSKGANPSNRFYINSQGSLNGYSNYYSKHIYIVSQVRPR